MRCVYIFIHIGEKNEHIVKSAFSYLKETKNYLDTKKLEYKLKARPWNTNKPTDT